MIHRAHFHSALCRLAAQLGVNVTTDSNVVSYDESAPSVKTGNGREYSADLVVAADGVRSTARPVVLGGEDAPAERTGFAAYRAVVATELMKDDPDLAWLLEKPALNVWCAVIPLLVRAPTNTSYTQDWVRTTRYDL